MTTEDILEKLRRKFCPPAWVFLEEVRSNVTWGNPIDALAMAVWHSRGLEIAGFEVKVSRADWLRELKNPEKADGIMGNLDRFWLVVSDPDIVRDLELPAKWGLLLAKGNGLHTVKKAPDLTPGPLHKAFVAEVFRRYVLGDERRQLTSEDFKAGLEQGRSENRDEVERQKAHAEEAQKIIADFEGVSGVKIRRWDRGNVAEAVKLIMTGEIQLQSLKRDMADAEKELLGVFNRLTELRGRLMDGSGGEIKKFEANEKKAGG